MLFSKLHDPDDNAIAAAEALLLGSAPVKIKVREGYDKHSFRLRRCLGVANVARENEAEKESGIQDVFHT
jgi:hypothetical protein